MLLTEEDSAKIKEYAFYLEQHGFDSVKAMLKELSPEDFYAFWEYFFALDLLSAISGHKSRLAIALADASGVTALPEDRKRIIFTIAKLSGQDIKTANIELTKHLGPYFKLLDKYIIGGAQKTYEDIVKRCKEIQVGYVNLAYLAVETQIRPLIDQYKGNDVNDIEKLRELNVMAAKAIAAVIDFADFPPSTPELLSTLQTIKQYYAKAGRLQLDIDKLDDETDFDDVICFITTQMMIYNTKFYLIKRGIPLDNYKEVEKYVRRAMAISYFDNNFVTTDELRREGKPLLPKGKA